MAEDTKTPPDEQEANSDAVDEQVDDGLPANEVAVEDAGTLRKKVTITVPRERIDAKFDEMFGELGRSAQVPGFRIGHAPRRLIEKRFGKEVSEDVRNALVGEAMGGALEEQELKVLGEPDIDLEAIELPDSGGMSFSLEVEVEPEFDLPDYKGIEVERVAMEITDEHVDQAVQRMLAPMARLKPVDSATEAGDFFQAEVTITADGEQLAETNLEMRVAPGQVEGIPIEDLADASAGKKAGDKFTTKATVPAGHPNEDWREKEVEVAFEVKDVKRLELPELTDEFATSAGFESAEQLRQGARTSLEGRLDAEKQQHMRDQVYKFLLDNTELELPEAAAARHTQQAIQRSVVDLMMRGTPREEIQRNMQQIEAEVSAQAASGLKLSFILAKIAEAEGLEVEEGEINSRVAQIARSQRRRPERLRSELESDGRLSQLASNMVEEKAADKILAEAKIVDAKPEKDAADDKPDKPKPKAKKTTKKKTTKKAANEKKAASKKKSGGGGSND